MFELSTPEIFIKEWLHLLDSAKNKDKAIDVYQGRSVSELKKAKQYLDAGIIFLSTGLGLINENYRIPNYNLTVSEGRNSLKKEMEKWSIDESIWLEKLINFSGNNFNFYTPNSIIFIALPQNYLKMLLPTLNNLSVEILNNLYLFIHPSSLHLLSDKLKECYMPYNYQMESSDFAGTKVDYCQRCLHHFSQYIYKNGQSREESIKKILEFISTLPQLTPTVRRLQVDDKAIKKLILEGWNVCEGRSSKLLRYIRDEKNIACEQSRFQKIWATTKEEKKL